VASVRTQVSFNSADPALAGHFPGHPIVPGALLLSDVAVLVSERFGRQVAGVRVGKFPRPVLPDVSYDLHMDQRPDGAIEFRCEGSGGTVASGILELQPI
jgi:3-hydroxyacyl-[acyl-carrier-protein] dehydratase